MPSRASYQENGIRWAACFILMSACVEPIDFDLPSAGAQTVIEGLISDAPGPYQVKISRGLDLNTDSLFNPISNAVVKLFDDEGVSEGLTEIRPGIYETGGTIQGQMGHSYYIQVQTPDGSAFESAPETIMPVGELTGITYEFESRTTKTPFGQNEADVFNIYVDGHAASTQSTYLRWRFTGTYKITTFPQNHVIWFTAPPPLADPRPCSGYVIEPGLGGGNFVQVSPCTCCDCYISVYEEAPLVSDGQFVQNNQFAHMKVAEASVSSATFHEKYVVEVEQMSLNKDAYDFFKLLHTQKTGATSLFQPPSGKIIGNMKLVKGTSPVVGMFWATSVSTKIIAIPRSAVPYLLTPMDQFADACTLFDNATTTKPPFW